MIKKTILWLAGAIFVLQSCSVKSESTYYPDTATSMESNILMDKTMLGMMNMMSGAGTETTKNQAGLRNLTTAWKSLYDIQKDQKITLNKDSAQVLKKMYLKLNMDNGEIMGLSLKYDKLLPKELKTLLSQSKQLKKIPLQDFGSWDGKSLTIDTEKFNSVEFLQEITKNADKPANDAAPKTKSDSMAAYGKQMASGMVGMLRMVNMNFTNTLKFQKPIKTITGKHDFVKQLDAKTIQINVRSADLLDSGKSLTNKDKKIVVTTE